MTAAIWYYPNADRGRLKAINLPYGFASLEVAPDAIRSDSVTLGGEQSGVLTRIRDRVGVSLEGISGTAHPQVVRDLLDLQAHLIEGGTCALTADLDRAWAGYAPPFAASATGVQTRGNTWQYGTENANATLGDGDEVVLCAPGRAGRTALISGLDNGRIGWDTTGAPVLDYRDAPWVLVRHRWFFPALQLGPGDVADLVTSEAGRQTIWRFEADLYEDLRYYAALAGSSQGVLADTSGQGAWPLQISQRQTEARAAAGASDLLPRWAR